MARKPITKTRGRLLLRAVLQRTSTYYVAARVGCAHASVVHWANLQHLPNERARRALEANYGIPVTAWVTCAR